MTTPLPERSDELFAQLTRYANQSDNAQDIARRADCLGLGGRGILVAPGAIVR